MTSKILSWNERGSNAGKKKARRRRLKKWKADVICLQETRCHSPNGDGRRVGVDGWSRFFLDAQGSARTVSYVGYKGGRMWRVRLVGIWPLVF